MRRPVHKPPSRIRYEKSHPTASCRLNKETYDLLKQRLAELGNASFADFVKDALGKLQFKISKSEEDAEREKEEAKKEGYRLATKEWQICYPCSVCKKKVALEPNSIDHHRIIDIAKEKHWAHESCLWPKGKPWENKVTRPKASTTTPS